MTRYDVIKMVVEQENRAEAIRKDIDHMLELQTFAGPAEADNLNEQIKRQEIVRQGCLAKAAEYKALIA